MNIEVFHIGETAIEVRRKGIKNLHVGVYPPDGQVRVSAPEEMSIDAVKMAVLMRTDWIHRKRRSFLAQERQTVRRYVSGETHFVFGRPYRLEVIETKRKGAKLFTTASERMVFEVPNGASAADRKRWMTSWRRSELRRAAGPRVDLWSKRIGVAPSFWGIREMRTKWGSCNHKKRLVWLNLDLSAKPKEALDYVIVHELAHLVSHKHDDVFRDLVDHHFPRWRRVRSELNAMPLRAWDE
ncbi:M48 family metallopeptidase [Maritimibacter alexandrii]|uniref:M48 family metallopeptidase n=1 Tax=Maritimibacter alexandrii TaxID=2570355 RepID=UPI001108C474|nr:SprT family zinc-dependent metalloprotease [Maritimibacter alexandrii]